MNTGLKAAALAASSLFLFGVAPAYAGADAVRAEAYFNAISGGNADTIASFYADDAEFHWVGGPLAGVYKGRDRIKSVWEKFAEAAGDIDHEVLQLSESANGKTSTVTARVKFKGEGEVPVKFILVYKEGKIANEVWQVDKPGPAYAKPEAKPEAEDKVAGAAPLPEAKPTRAPAGAAQAVVVTERSVAPKATPRQLAANTPDLSPAGPDAEVGAEADSLPGDENGAETADSEAAPSDMPLPEARKGEISPDKNRKAEPKLKAASPPKAKTPEEKKGGYAEKFDDRKVAKKKRTYDDGYGYDRYYDGYGYGGRGYGRYGGYDGYGYGRHGYGGRGYGGYGGYDGYGGYGGYGGGYGRY